jgi:hypothetical protein
VLSYRPAASLCSLAGRYDILMAESTMSPRKGRKIWPINWKECLVVWLAKFQTMYKRWKFCLMFISITLSILTSSAVSLQDRRNTVGDIRKNTGKTAWTGPSQFIKRDKKIENISFERAHAHFYNLSYILNFRGLNA